MRRKINQEGQQVDGRGDTKLHHETRSRDATLTAAGRRRRVGREGRPSVATPRTERLRAVDDR